MPPLSNPAPLPVLYSFRRCPYAMRARLAIAAAAAGVAEGEGLRVELREVVLRAKPAAFLAASSSGTVPCLVTTQGVIDESLDIMRWALSIRDPQGLCAGDAGDRAAVAAWIARCDGPFKSALDRTKYANRYPACDPEAQRALAAGFLADLDAQIGQAGAGWILQRQSLADLAIAPFVRQFSKIDAPWFADQPWPHLQEWLARFCASEAFAQVMGKYPPWAVGAAPTLFPQ